MEFLLSEEQLMIQKAARDFAQNDLKPGVIERDSKKIHPTAQLSQMGEMGFLGMLVKSEYGGSGMDTLSYVLAMDEISKIDALPLNSGFKSSAQVSMGRPIRSGRMPNVSAL